MSRAQLFANSWTRFFRKSNSPRRTRRNHVSRGVEMLESRIALAISVTNVPAWIDQGPSPITGGQTVGITDNPVTGSVHALAAHPTNADIIFAGGSNGGVWRTQNSTAANPTWTPLTDTFQSLSIGAMDFNPSNTNVLLVGIGGYAAGGFDALGSADGDRTGALISTNALAANPTFRQLGGAIAGQDASGVAARDAYLLVSGTNGLFRSTDNGDTFQSLSGTGGLPNGGNFDLIGDPANLNRFYVAGSFGVYRTEDASAATPIWTNVSNALQQITGATTNVEFALHNSAGNNVLYVGTVNNGRLAAVTFTTDQGTTWTAMDVPQILEAAQPLTNASNTAPITITANGHGLSNGDRVRISGVTGNTAANGDFVIANVTANTFDLVGSTGNGAYGGGGNWQEIVGTNPTDKPGSQGRIHFSIVASPTDPNLVWVGGDRQDGPFPNPIGGNNFTGNLWRGDRSIAPGGPAAIPSPQWTPITDNFAGGNSGPHADSREMVFDANGDIVEADDGGVYRRDNPTSNAGAWTSMNGNLSVAEFWTISLDTTNNVIFGGFQDTGTAEQSAANSTTWEQITQGDGFFTAADNTSIANSTVRYTVGNTFTSFQRRVFDNANNQVGATDVVQLAAPATPGTARSGLNAADQAAGASLNPFVLNATDARLMLVARTGVYEDNNNAGNAGDIVVDVTPPAMTGQARALAYGGFRAGVAYPEIAWVGTQGGQLFVRGEGAAAFTQIFTGGAGQVSDIVLNPDNWQHTYVLQGNQIWETTDGGTTFTDITDNLGTLSSEIRSLSLWDPNPGVDDGVIPVVGGRGGVYRYLVNPLCPDKTWTEYGNNMPNTIVQDLQVYGDTIVAGTYGRGAWTIADVSASLPNGASLTVTGNGGNNTMFLQLQPDNPNRLQVSDGLGNVQTFELGLFQQVSFVGLGGADTIRIDSNGNADGGTVDFVTFTVNVDAGGNAGDSLRINDRDETFITDVTIDASTVGAGASDNLFGDCGVVNYTGLQNGEIVINTGSGSDNFRVTDATPILRLNADGGLDNLFHRNVASTWTIDGTNDGNINNLVFFNSIGNLIGGSQTDLFDFGSTGFLTGTINGGGDKDTVQATRDVSYTLTNLLLTATDGLDVDLLSIENALLTGGASQNSFNVSGWTGMGTLDGVGPSKDPVIAAKNQNFTLSDTLLTATDGLMMTLVSIESALLTGGAANNLFEVTTWTGMGVINGAGGSDTITVTKDEDFVASDSQITTTDGMMLDLVSIETINLIGGPSPNRFDITPSDIATFNIDGLNPGFGDPAGGDSLFVDFTGTTGKRLKFSGPPDGIGMWTFTNKMPINFIHIEILLNFMGNVTSEQHGHDLILTGDDLANGISLTQAANGDILVYPLGTTLNGDPLFLPQSFAGVKNILVYAKGGDDFFQFNNISLDNFLMFGGDGDDQLQSGSGLFPDITTQMGLDAAIAAGSVNLNQNIHFDGGDGNDCADFIRTFGEAIWDFNLGNGNDTMTTYWSTSGAMSIVTDNDDDIVNLGYHIAYREVTIDGAKGNDFINVFISAFQDAFVAFGGAGYDTLAVDTNNFAKFATLDGGSEDDYLLFASSIVADQLALLGGSGNDTIILGKHVNGTSGGNIAKKLLLDGGSGNDKVTIGNNAFDEFFGLLGSGDDQVTIDDFILIKKKGTLNGGSGTDSYNAFGNPNLNVQDFG
ncbi:MAG: hypothetical protein SFX18_15905 [Pirellulales bacterium]|nr:hypothetical protein [Pirellulales bacterium]